jgi:hypothetical protein
MPTRDEADHDQGNGNDARADGRSNRFHVRQSPMFVHVLVWLAPKALAGPVVDMA